VRGMLAGERPTLRGRWYTVTDAINSPAPLSKIPVMIGGGGEKKTLRLVALYADESNIICGPDEVPRKLDALAKHCQAVGRDRSEIVVSVQANACVAPTHDEAVAEADAFLLARGIDLASMNEEDAAVIRAMIALGDPDEVGEIFANRLIDGVNGFTVNAPANCHIEGRVALLGEVLAKVVGL
jgi:alkanesulfonate monooxygenase SsuD/methylene tetrahydromethanopterin reductase-like flavin-dependent oxidoreductase (luciferase family)